MMRQALALTLVLAGCNNGHRNYDERSGHISGHAIKGPVSGATLSVVDGRTGQELGRGSTDTRGAFDVDVGTSKGELVICASGGTYTEEATATVVELGEVPLCTAVSNFEVGEQRSNVVITPWTALATTRADALVRFQALDFTTAVAQARSEVDEFLTCKGTYPSVINAEPVDPTAVRETQGDLTSSVLSGILLGGLSSQAKLISERLGLTAGITITATSVLAAYEDDLARDGQLNGVGKTGQIAVHGYPLSADSIRGTREGFAHGIRAFVLSDRNATGVTVNDLHELLTCIGDARGALFADGPTSNLDLQGPELKFEAPASGSFIAGAVAVQVAATDASDIEDLWFEASPGLAARLPQISGPVGSITAQLLTASLVDGPYTITVHGRDVVGNIANAVLDVNINNGAPVINLEQPVVLTGLSGVVTIVATASDPQGVAELNVAVPEGLVDLDPSPARFEAEWDSSSSFDGAFSLSFYAEDGEGNGAVGSFTLELDNFAPSVAEGVVALDTPVKNATVQILKIADGARGALIGSQPQTGDDGAFSIPLPDTYAGYILVRAYGAGASYTDTTTGESVSFGASDELLLLIDYASTTSGSALTDLSPNALTTMAARLAFRFHAQGMAFEDAVNLAHRLFAEHVQRPGPFELRQAPGSDFTTDPIADSQDAHRVGLFHVGLSRLGAELAIQAGLARTSMPTLDVLPLLLRDLEDNVFDGVAANDQTIAITTEENLATDTLRSQIAIAIIRWLNDEALPDGSTGRNNSTLLAAHFASPGGFLDVMSSDTSELFGSEPPTSFDIVGPAITLTSPAEGAAITAAMTINATASDPSDIQGMLGYLDGRPDAAIGADQNAAPGVYVANFNPAGLLEGHHTLRIVALDTRGNASMLEVPVFVDGTAPVLTASLPALVNSPTVTVTGTVTETASPVSQLAFAVAGETPTIVINPTSPFNQTITVPCNASSTITITATNSAGLTSEKQFSIACDSRSPAITLGRSSYVPADQIAMRYRPALGDIKYDRPAASEVALDSLSWDDTGAPPELRQFFTHFDYIPGVADISTNGLPWLALVPNDFAQGGTEVGSQPTAVGMAYRYYVGSTLKHDWRSLAISPDNTTFELPISYQTLGVELASNEGAAHRISVRAIDQAGNLSIRDFYFHVQVSSPHAFYVDCVMDSDLIGKSLAANNLRDWFSLHSAGIMAARLVLPSKPTSSLAPGEYTVTPQDGTATWSEGPRREAKEEHSWDYDISGNNDLFPTDLSCAPGSASRSNPAKLHQVPPLPPGPGYYDAPCTTGFYVEQAVSSLPQQPGNSVQIASAALVGISATEQQMKYVVSKPALKTPDWTPTDNYLWPQITVGGRTFYYVQSPLGRDLLWYGPVEWDERYFTLYDYIDDLTLTLAHHPPVVTHSTLGATTVVAVGACTLDFIVRYRE